MSEKAFEQYWTIPQVAERLQSGESTVRKWLTQRRLKKTKAGDRTLISESALQTFLRECTEQSDSAA